MAPVAWTLFLLSSLLLQSRADTGYYDNFSDWENRDYPTAFIVNLTHEAQLIQTQCIARFWDKRTFAPSKCFNATRTEDIDAAVDYAKARGMKVRAAGSLHSWNSAPVTGGVLILTQHYDQIINVDAAAGQVTVQGGCSIHKLLDYLYPMGLTVTGWPGGAFQTVAGFAMAAGHGSTPSTPDLGDQIVSARVVSAQGPRILTRDSVPSVRELPGSLGIFGIVTEVTLAMSTQRGTTRLQIEKMPRWPDEPATSFADRVFAKYNQLFTQPNIAYFELYFQNEGGFRLNSELELGFPVLGPPSASTDDVHFRYSTWCTPIDSSECRRDFSVGAYLRGDGGSAAGIGPTPDGYWLSWEVTALPTSSLRDLIEVHYTQAVPSAALGNIKFRAPSLSPLSPAFVKPSNKGWASGTLMYEVGHMKQARDQLAASTGHSAIKKAMSQLGVRPHVGFQSWFVRDAVDEWLQQSDAIAQARALDPDGMFVNPYVEDLYHIIPSNISCNAMHDYYKAQQCCDDSAKTVRNPFRV